MPRILRLRRASEPDASPRGWGATVAWSVAVVFALAATVTSVMLVSQHFGASLPGCGPTAGCAKLQTSVHGKIPGVGWPFAFVGLAYFAGMSAALLSARRFGFGWGIRVVSWLGVLASLGFVGLMVHLEEFCLYCAVTHAFNVAMVGSSEVWNMMMRTKRAARRWTPVVALVGVALVCSGGVGAAYAAHEAEVARAAEADREKSAHAIIERNTSAAVEQPVDRWGSEGFTGRYRKGPEEAAIRIVVLTDYQCPDCRRVEGEIEEVLAARADASLSVKHFPMCVDCNKYAGRTLHGNACWAARAAEAAGILGGDEAFFKMHTWLFENKGEFETAAVLEPGVRAAGLEPSVFTAVMQSAQTLKNVQADVEDGMALGLYSTPMVFINGVEFKGWQATGAFKKTVEEVAATHPPSRTAAADRPVLAAQRYVDDWKEGRTLPRTEDKTSWTTGVAAGASAPEGEQLVEVVVFGDYQESNTVRLDGQLMEAMKGRTNVRYTFRHYPVDPACNPALPAGVPASAVRPMACTAARAVEAAGAVGGNDGYWKMHRWLMENSQKISDESISEAAKGFGFDTAKFEAHMGSAAAAEAIAEDCRAGRMLGLRSIPFVTVNNKQVLRTWLAGENIIKRILDEASGTP